VELHEEGLGEKKYTSGFLYYFVVVLLTISLLFQLVIGLILLTCTEKQKAVLVIVFLTVFINVVVYVIIMAI